MPGFVRWIGTPAGRAPVIKSELGFSDTLGGWKARWGIGRMSYLVPPGLYAIGSPDADSLVAVTANYKMSYDLVRNALTGRNIWLLVLETYGINVWCAAGKGTFGTGELVRRIEKTRLSEIVNHRVLLLPLLGAAGVKGIEVNKRTGFTCLFATIRAVDLPAYMDNNLVAVPEMRELSFNFIDRLVLIPVELVGGIKNSSPLMLLVFLVGLFSAGQFLPHGGIIPVIALLGAIIAGTIVAPLLLPWLPTRSFAIKGAFAGLCWAILFILFFQGTGRGEIILLLLTLPAVSGFFTLNFTGSTPFTSRSGVKKEMRWGLPLMALASLAGICFWIWGRLA